MKTVKLTIIIDDKGTTADVACFCRPKLVENFSKEKTGQKCTIIFDNALAYACTGAYEDVVKSFEGSGLPP